nr:hypothetical protein [Gammaproteobacteria bacterium]
MDQATLDPITLVVGVFLVILAILWFCLPFAIFGTKAKLNELIVETRRTNEELALLRRQLDGSNDKLSVN